MGLRHRSEMPSAQPSIACMRAARALSESLLDGDPLPPLFHNVDRLRAGEVQHASWVGPCGTLHARDFSKFRHWRLLLEGRPLMVNVTSERLQVLPEAEDIRIRAIRDLAPRARDLSVLDIKLRSGDRLRLWGEHVPELTVMLGWLRWHRVITVPLDSTSLHAEAGGVG
jgi:hypothetical protein